MTNVLDFNSAARQDAPVGSALVDAADIRARLNRSAREFVDWMFSGRALCNAREARIGDTAGTAGSSLSIALAGESAGQWHDHATGESGDLIGLYMAYMGYQRGNFQLALKEIASEFLRDPVEVRRASFQPTANQRIAEKKAKLGDKPRADDLELGLHVAEWKYYDLTGSIIAAVKRFEPDGTPASKTYRPYCFKIVDGQRRWKMGAPELRPLYRLPEIALAQTVVLVEGEKCAQALADLGIDATTAMQGAEAPIERTDWTPLTGKTVIIWPDNDVPGLAYARRVSERLTAIGCTVLGVAIPPDAPAKWDAADCIAGGGDPREIIASALPMAVDKPRIRLLDVDDLEAMAPPQWLIDGILTVNGLSMMWGRSGAMKSFVALDMALCIATGHPWQGHSVRQGRVVYIAAEGASGLSRRIVGWRKTKGKDLPKPAFQLVPHGLTMAGDDLVALINALGTEPLSMVVVDTVSRTIGGGDLNKPNEVNAYVQALDRLREATGANVCVVHHGGKDDDRNELGNEGLRNASDTVIHIKRTNDTINVINEAPKGKQKDFEEFQTIRLKPVKSAYMLDDTEHVTLNLMLEDPVAMPSEDGSDGTRQRSKTKPSKHEETVLEALAAVGVPVGFTRLRAMTGIAPASLTRALDNLCERKLASRADAGEGLSKLWKLEVCS